MTELGLPKELPFKQSLSLAASPLLCVLLLISTSNTHGFLTFGSTSRWCHVVSKSAWHGSATSTTDSGNNIQQNRLKPLCMAGLSEREKEIRRKISKLKKQGKIKDSVSSSSSTASADADYESRIRQKLGNRKSKLLGISSAGRSEDADLIVELEDDEDMYSGGRIGPLGTVSGDEEVGKVLSTTSASESSTVKSPLFDPSLFDDGGQSKKEEEKSEEELIDLVASKMMEKRDRERREKEARLRAEARKKLKQIEEERQLKQRRQVNAAESDGSQPKKLTSSVGGSWAKNESAETDMYQPKSGSWGAFPRPRDISKAYGGGRRVGPGYSEESAAESAEATRERLRRYREKVGIDVQSEKEHAGEIEQALNIGQLAMQRGIYSTAVSALEKVTKYCSTNSKVGGRVFLELAMAYEAVGRTNEAITVYQKLTKSRIEDIKYNAKRLLYGIEAIQFMRDDVGAKEFQRKKVKNTFIDTTGLANIASNFDDVYQTAYVDLEGGFYKKLSQSVVRSPREARQILLRATDAGEESRMRVVQALRSLSRRFDDSLQEELERRRVQEPVAMMDGKPIIRGGTGSDFVDLSSRGDDFQLADAQAMMENLQGEWRLQLLADKRGDGVKYFNSTNSWQLFDMESFKFDSQVLSGFATVQQSGGVDFNKKRRILRRRSVEASGGNSFLSGLFGGKGAGPAAAVANPQQVMTVDSILLITRGVPSKRVSDADDEKDYFAVWRRVDPGTYSGRRSSFAQQGAMSRP